MKTSQKPVKSHFFVPEERPRKKKSLGQHFLRTQSVVDHMIDKVVVTNDHSVLEIGCGDGFLTRSILNQTNCKQLWCYEIDPSWADHVRRRIDDPRLTIHEQNILDLDVTPLEGHTPWVVLANLPYCITFPILKLLVRNRHLFSEGVVMMQEEVAQKVVASKGKKYSPVSLYLQNYFAWELMEKIPPGAFSPPPKVDSRLLYFKPKANPTAILEEERFWHFISMIFRMPRRTLRNNLKTTHHNLDSFDPTLLSKRAQELSFQELLKLWQEILASEQD